MRHLAWPSYASWMGQVFYERIKSSIPVLVSGAALKEEEKTKNTGSIPVPVSGEALKEEKNTKKMGSIPVPVSGAALEDQKS